MASGVEVLRAIAQAGAADAKTGFLIAYCESTLDEHARNPSSGAWGLWQILPSTDPSINGNPDVNAQAAAAVHVGLGAGNTRPWDSSKGCWGPGASGPRADAARKAYDDAVTALGGLSTGPGVGGLGLPDIGSILTDALKSSLEKLLGMPLGEFALRWLEVAGGAVILAAGIGTFAVVLARRSPTARAAGQAGRQGGRTLQRAGRTVASVGTGGGASAGGKVVAALTR